MTVLLAIWITTICSSVALALPDSLVCTFTQRMDPSHKAIKTKNNIGKQIAHDGPYSATFSGMLSKEPRASGEPLIIQSGMKSAPMAPLSRNGLDNGDNYQAFWYDIHELDGRTIMEFEETKTGEIEVYAHILGSAVPEPFRKETTLGGLRGDYVLMGKCRAPSAQSK